MPIGSGTSLGMNSRLGFAAETNWGSATAANNFMEFRSATFRKTEDEEKLESLGTGRAIGRRVKKNVNVEGALSYDLHPVDAIAFIKHAFMGTVTSAQMGATGGYNHTFTLGDMSTITQKGLTFEVQPDSNTTTTFIHHGLRINSLKISGSINETLKAEIDFIGRDSTTGTFATTTVAYSGVRPFLFNDVQFFYDGTTASITSASEERIISFELNIENNLQNEDTARSLGSRVLTALPPGRRNVTLSIVQRFDTTTAWSRFINDTQGAIRLLFNTGITMGAIAGATTYAMYVDLGKVFYNSAIPEISGAEILTHEVEITAVADTITGSGTDIIITAVNTATSY